MSQPVDTRLNLSAGLLSVAVALLLIAVKFWALIVTGSLSIAATLADSGIDLLMSAGGLAAIAYAAKPADDDHNFGHTSAEDLAALAQSVFILVSATVIVVVAVQRLLAPEVLLPKEEAKGIAVAVFAIVVTFGLVVWQRRVIARTGNKVIAADNLHYIGDLIPNGGAVIALALSRWTGNGRIDSWIAIFAAAFLVFGALRIGKRAWDALMDRQADPETIADIARIAGAFEGVRGFHDLKTRVAGSRVFVNLHIELDGGQTLDQAHAIGAALRRAILAAHPNADVMIHKDPVGVTRHPDDPGH